MNTIKVSDIKKCIDNKNNKFINIDGVNIEDIKVMFDCKLDENYNLAYIIGSIIGWDKKILSFIDKTNLNDKSKNEIDKINLLLEKNILGKIKVLSTRSELIQLEIQTKNSNYQLEIHLGNHNFCLCEDYDVVAVDSYK